jgi:hypothetical protein
MSDASNIAIKLFIGSCLSLFTLSCEVDFSPNMISDPIPVVFGIINPDDSIYYLRLAKTFQCNSNTGQCVKQPLIQFFDHPTVEFELLALNGRLLNRGLLKPMIAPLKEPGFFSQEPNWVYGIPKSEFEFESEDPFGNLTNGSYLILKIKTTETSIPTYSKVAVRNRATDITPRDHLNYKFGLFDQRMETVTWKGFSNQFHTLIFRVRYEEYLSDTIRNKAFDIIYPVDPQNLEVSGTLVYKYLVDGQDFLRKMKLAFSVEEEPSDLDYRKVTSLDILVVSINDDYRLYINALNRDANVDIPTPSNIVNGIGLFCVKRIATSSGHFFNNETMDSIANSQITKHLKFVKWTI